MTHTERAPLLAMKTPLRNRRKRPVELRLEPWGERYTMPAGATFQIVARGPEGDSLEIEWGQDAVTVYGWPGSVVSVLRKGIDVGAGEGEARSPRETAPFLPPGMRVKEWLSEMQALSGAALPG